MPKFKSNQIGKSSRNWHLVNVENKILGRVATKIANLLMGKVKPEYLANSDNGDYVVVTNAAKIKVTGKKLTQKIYTTYSGYPGGMKRETFGMLHQRQPGEVIRRAVWGMLPKNKLRDRMIIRLYTFAGNDHPYEDKILKIKN